MSPDARRRAARMSSRWAMDRASATPATRATKAPARARAPTSASTRAFQAIRTIPNTIVKRSRRIGLEDLGSHHARVAWCGASRRALASACKRARPAPRRRAPAPTTRRSNLTRERGCLVDAVPLKPTLDLTARHATVVRDEMHMTTQYRVSRAHAGFVVESMRELHVNARIARARVASPILVGIP